MRIFCYIFLHVHIIKTTYDNNELTGGSPYLPEVFGTIWIKSTGLTEDEHKKSNMMLVSGLTYVFSFFVAAILNSMVIHRFGFQSMLMGEKELFTAGSEANTFFTSTM